MTGNTLATPKNIGIQVNSFGNITIEHNLILGTHEGINIFSGDQVTIRNNVIVGTSGGWGGVIWGTSVYDRANSSITFTQNIIENNQPYSVYNWGSSNVSMTNNWWGITNASQIVQSIHDYHTDNSLGTISFEPILSSPPFTVLMNITFAETGLPSGTLWGVNFNGTLRESTSVQ